MDKVKDKYKPTVVLQLCQTNHFTPLYIYFTGSNVTISPTISALVSVVKRGFKWAIGGIYVETGFCSRLSPTMK